MSKIGVRNVFFSSLCILSIVLLIEGVSDLLTGSQANWLLLAGIGLGVAVGSMPHFVERIRSRPAIAGLVVLVSALFVIVLLWKPATRLGLPIAGLVYVGIHFWSRKRKKERLSRRNE